MVVAKKIYRQQWMAHCKELHRKWIELDFEEASEGRPERRRDGEEKQKDR